MKQIRTAGIEDAKSITDLRVSEYKRSKDFTLLKPEKLFWNETDDNETVLGIWDENDQVIATMRMVRVTDLRHAETIMKSEVPGRVEFPALIFNAAATRKEWRRKGFNQLLRYYCIQIAKVKGMQSLLSPVFKKSPRINFMKELGYVCQDRHTSWQSTLVPGSPLILCVLGADQFDHAIAAIKEAIPKLIEEYPWTDPAIAE